MPHAIFLLNGQGRCGKDTFAEYAEGIVAPNVVTRTYANAAPMKLISIQLIKFFYGHEVDLELLNELKNTQRLVPPRLQNPRLALVIAAIAAVSALFEVLFIGAKAATAMTFLCLLAYFTLLFAGLFLWFVSMLPQVNVRHLLQQLGTEMIRGNVFDSIWVDAVIKRIQAGSADVVFITDCRFDNEVSGILEAFPGIVHLVKIHRNAAGLTGTAAKHSSEGGLKLAHEEAIHHIIDNNGSLENYYKCIEGVLTDAGVELVD